MTKRSLIVLAIFAAAATLRVAVPSAQAPAGPPKPGPHHKELEYFVGKWLYEGAMKANPLSPGGTIAGTETCELFTGGFQVVCRTEATFPTGPLKMLGLLAYDPGEKTYTYFAIDSQGMGGSARGTLTDSGAWVYLGQSKMGGKPTKSRYTVQKVNADTFTSKWELAQEDGPFTVIMEVKQSRMK